MNKNLGEAIGGNADAAKTFSELGINLASVKDGSQSAADLLPTLAAKFAEAGSDAERTALDGEVAALRDEGMGLLKAELEKIDAAAANGEPAPTPAAPAPVVPAQGLM